MAGENNVVGEVYLLVKPLDRGFQRDVQSIIDRAGKDASFKLSADTQQAQQNVQALGNEVGRLNQGFIDAAINVAGVTAAFFALRGAVNKTLSVFGGLFDQLAQARAGFTSILKSEAAGGQLLDDIREFARVSPFVTQELVNYSQQLLGVGLSAERIVPLLEDTGNIIASVGGDTANLSRVLFTLTQIQSIGRLAGQDAMQLQSSLIPITKYLSEFLGKTTAEVKKLQEQGKISADTVFAAISAQGDKVAGAMDKATKNIAGARAILSDTITIMLQEQPVLQQIFEDIYKGLLSLAAFLDTDEVRQSIDAFFVSVGKLYDALAPLGDTLVLLASTGGLQALEAMTSILGVLAQVLDALPVGIIEAFARVLAALAIIKAPLMLLQYAQSFTAITRGALGASVALSRKVVQTNADAAASLKAAAANNTLAASQTNVSRTANLVNRVRGNASALTGVGLAVGGSILSDGNGGARDIAGGAATGAAIGSVAGPWGIAAGAAIGGLASIVTASRKAAAEVRRHADEARQAWVIDVVETIDRTFGGEVNTASLTAYFGEVTKLTDQMYNLRTAQLLAQSAADSFVNVNTDAYVTLSDVAKNYENQVLSTADMLSKLLKDETYAAALGDARDNLALLTAANEDLLLSQVSVNRGFSQANFEVLTGQDIPRTAEEFVFLTGALDSLGISIEQLATLSTTELQALIDNLKAVPNAYKEAAAAADLFNKRYTDSKAVTDAFTSSVVAQIETQQKLQSAVQAAYSAAQAAVDKPEDRNAQLEAEKQAILLRAEVINQAAAAELKGTTALRLGELAYQDAITARANAQAAAAGLAKATTDEQIAKLLELSGVADTLDNRQIAIEVITQGFEAAMAKLELLARQIIALRQLAAGQVSTFARGGLASGGGPNLAAEAGDLASQRYSQNYQLAQGKIPNQTLESIAAAVGAAVRANDAKAGGGGGGGGESAVDKFNDALKSATQSLTDVLESAAESIQEASKRWVASIKERTQYEQAVSASRLTSNTRRQLADINELASGLQNLRGRGVTQDVLDALGIDNVADVRQVRRLVGASDADLAALTASLAELNDAALGLATTEEDKRTRDNITAGIIAAAEALGIDTTTEKATSITNQLNITADMDAETIALQILSLLTSGRIK